MQETYRIWGDYHYSCPQHEEGSCQKGCNQVICPKQVACNLKVSKTMLAWSSVTSTDLALALNTDALPAATDSPPINPTWKEEQVAEITILLYYFNQMPWGVMVWHSQYLGHGVK